jgi:two-component system OmpR family sensor kinase
MGFAIDNAQSYEELKRLDEIKSNFISVVSHQLRTPVTVTRCNLELCLDTSVSQSEKTDAVKAAYEGTLNLGRQLDQLLTVLEIEEKNIILKKRRTRINNLIQQVVDDNRLNILNKDIQLKVDNDKDDLEINCDENRVKKVLDILLVNSISYVFAKGQISILVKKEFFDKKPKLIISVCDNGIGIAEDSRNEIFKKFFRSPEAVAILPNGFGLGLFIARKIIEAHGGEVWFEPNDGKGATFSFSLPLN